MTTGRIATVGCILFLIVLAWASWMFRYDLLAVGGGQDGYGLAYRLDRWTGSLRVLDGDQWYPVVEGEPDSFKESGQFKESAYVR